MRYYFLLLFLLLAEISTAQKIRIFGNAPDYKGKSIEVYRIDDYLSDKTSMITSSTVDEKGSFSLGFVNEDVRKVLIKSNNNWAFLYIQPDASYHIYFAGRDRFDPVKESGNEIELSFYELDSTDINYKILSFQRWVDEFIGYTYHLRNDKLDTKFNQELDTFKTNVELAYQNDTSFNSLFFKTYVKFAIAGLDNINTIAERNRYEKHDFYLVNTPVQYQNDVYMDYLIAFYEQLIPRLPNETNEAFYQAILHSSPTMMMNALRGEYTLKNLRIREFVMIEALSEAYYSEDFPQTNVETMLDSLSHHCLFEDNEIIAKNILDRLTDLVPGSKAPDFVLLGKDQETLTLTGFEGKYLYINFIDARSEENLKELELIGELRKEYGDYVEFLTVYKEGDIPQVHREKLSENPWKTYGLSPDNSIFQKYRVVNFPQYVLIDLAGYIVANPAMSPVPNGDYESIDQTFFLLKRAIDAQNNDESNPYDPNR